MSSESLNQFLDMGGYAFYVWGSFGVAVLVWGWNLLVPRLQRKQILKQLIGQEE